MRGHGGLGVSHDPHVAEQGVHETRRLRRDLEPGRDRLARAGRVGAGPLGKREHRERARGALGCLGRAGEPGGVCARLHHGGRERLAQQALDELVELGRRAHEVGEAPPHETRELGVLEHAPLERVLAAGELRVDLTKRRKRGVGPGEPGAGRVERRGRLALGGAGGLALGGAVPDSLLGGVERGLGALDLARELLEALAPALERRLGRLDRLLDLGDAALEHLVLDLGVRDLVGKLRVRERGLVEPSLALPLLARELGLDASRLAPGRRGGLGGRLQLGHVGLEALGGHARVGEAARHVVALARGLAPLAVHLRERHARLGEAVHHVSALLLEKAHVGVEPSQDVGKPAALLAEVAHEEALLLEQALELLELAGLLVHAELRELHGGRSLALAALQLGPLALEPAHVVDGELAGELGEARVKLLEALGLVDLALEGAQLPGKLARDVLGAHEVLVHVDELPLRALLAPAVLGDAGGLLHEAPALLGPAREDGVELALRDDGVRLLAEARVVQDVLDVHEARRRAVDEVLGLARAVHPPGDAHLGEVDGQRVVGVVEHERDLGHAHGLARAGAGEDHVLHGLAAQHLGALLAEDPEDGVGDVGLARAVGPHHDGEAGVEHHVRAVREGLEALQREGLQVHGMPSSARRSMASAAAALSASFLEEPTPRPSRLPWTSTTEVKVGL